MVCASRGTKTDKSTSAKDMWLRIGLNKLAGLKVCIPLPLSVSVSVGVSGSVDESASQFARQCG